MDLPAPEITLQATPSLVDRGATALLTGQLTAPAGITSLTLEALPVGSLEAVALGGVSVAADGRFSVRVTPSSSTDYRVRVPATGGFGAGSVSAVVAVRRAVGLNWSPSVLHAGRVGTRVSIVATIDPVASNAPIMFRLERWSPVSRSWRLVGTLSRRSGSTGHAMVTWTPSGAALYRWRTTAGWEPDYSTGSSSWVRWSIAR
jgi:hypothetical protein